MGNVLLGKTKGYIAALLLAVVFPAYAGVAVIANPSLSVTTLTPEQVTDIFLGKTRSFPSGERAIPLDQGVGSEARQEFYLKVLKKSDSDMKSYWSHIVFTGKGRPPLQQDGGDDTIKQLIENNPTLLGYINSKNVDSSVRVLLLVE